jgi:hypothetical protein
MRHTVGIAALVVLLAAAPAPADLTPPTLHLAQPRAGGFAYYNARVMHAFLIFTPARGLEERANPLETLRARDQLRLVAGQAPNDEAGGLGALLMSLTCAAAAHAPGPVRALFAGPVHLGPAVFDGGGLGAGVGGHWL